MENVARGPFKHYKLCPYKGTALIALAIVAIFSLGGCGGSSVKTTSVTTGASNGAAEGTTTTTVRSSDGITGTNVNVDVRREVEPNAPIDPNNTTVEMGSDAPAGVSGSDGDRVHVNMPGVHVNVDHATGAKDIDVPFVHIHKDGQGHSTVDTPFVHVDKDQ